MLNRTLQVAMASGILYFVMSGSSIAQVALSSCDAATGLTPSGQQCVTLTPVEPTRYQTQISGEGASNYSAVNVGELAETYQCDPSGGNNTAVGNGGALLIEDCGAPLNLDPSTFQEFVGYSGNAAPAPIPQPAAPVAAFTPPPPPPAPAATVIAAPVAPTALASTGLGFGGVAAGLVGVAALGAIIAVASDNNSSTNTTRRP